jgi:hypothetical protein
MRGLRSALIAMGAALSGASLAGLALAGCGDDSTSNAPGDSGSDGPASEDVVQADAPTDTTPPKPDAGDAGDADSTTPPSEAGSDGTMPMETGSETSTNEAGPEASVDASDAGADVDAAPPYTGLEFANQYAAAYCNAFLNCCQLATPGLYNTNDCIVAVANEGWEQSLPDTNVYARGHTTANQTKAMQCITALSSFPCGTQTAAEWQAITNACELVVTGTIPIGSTGCISSFECAPNSYCDPNNDGGTCTALATQGQPCDTAINSAVSPIPDQMCNYLGSQNVPLYCNLLDNGADAATCQPTLPAGSACTNTVSPPSSPLNGYYDDLACQPPALCGDNLECGGTTSYPYPFFCQTYLIDAGGG